MNRIELKNRAKKVLEGKVLAFFLVILIPAVVFSLISMTIWGTIVPLLLSGAAAFAMATIFLTSLRKNSTPQIEDLLVGFKNNNFGRTFEGFVRLLIFTFLWSLLFIIPGIVKAFEYSMMFFLMADDKNLSAGEAQKKSMRLMNGHKMDLFVLYLSFIPWILVVAVTFGIASIYVMPYIELAYAAFYDKLVSAGKHSKAKEAELA